ncbi:unnamed protein product [Tenebrio molitor]|nr:unnamed protein product [Tenebrio molitor]
MLLIKMVQLSEKQRIELLMMIGYGNRARTLKKCVKTFCLNGTVNRQNCRYWTRENPHWMQEIHTQYPQKVNVWARIIDDRILGPFFFANNLTGDRYLQFLQLELMPALATLFSK